MLYSIKLPHFTEPESLYRVYKRPPLIPVLNHANSVHFFPSYTIKTPLNIALTSRHRTLYHLTPNDDYSGRTAPLTSKRCILYFYSTNIGTEYFKHGTYSPFFTLFKMQFVS